MKKISLIATLISAVLLLQNCKKDTVTASTISSEPMIALINDTTWIADTVNATMTYTAATKTKTLSCSGISNNKKINFYITQNSASSTPGFGIDTYTADGKSDTLSYEYPQKNSMGNLVLMPQGVVSPGSGSVSVTTVDSVKKVISGTFYFNSIKSNTDGSITIAAVLQGGFNNVPYTFITQ